MGTDHSHVNTAGHEDTSHNVHPSYQKSLLHPITIRPEEGLAHTASLGDLSLIPDLRAFPSGRRTKHEGVSGISAFRYIKNPHRKRADTDD